MNWKFSGDRPVYQQICELIRGAVLTGELKPGPRIPSVREIAAQAQVNPNTVQRALSELEREALLRSGGPGLHLKYHYFQLRPQGHGADLHPPDR